MLIELDGEDLRPELGTVEGQWFEMLARKSRLQAERDGLDAITFDPELTSRAATSPEIATLIAAQEQQFAARRKSQDEEEAQLEEQQTPDRQPERGAGGAAGRDASRRSTS